MIKTDRLVLRPVDESEAAEFYPLFSDAEISRDMAWSPHSCLEQSRSFLREAARSFKASRAIHWSVRSVDSLIGMFSLIDLRGQHRAIEYNRAELAYWVVSGERRRGFMTEAGEAVIDFAFEEIELNKLIVSHHVGNAASEGLIRKLGFRKLYEEEQAFRKDGKLIDVVHYDLLRSAWALKVRK